MELPPLSPGIQARVMEEVEVVETVSRGWSGGTEEETPGVNKSMALPRKQLGGEFEFKSPPPRLPPFLP